MKHEALSRIASMVACAAVVISQGVKVRAMWEKPHHDYLLFHLTENPQFGPASSKIDLALSYLLLPFGIKPTVAFPL
tara:strand:- start:2 stop:232 length:231 start_codon:yes stop_codon:yes gene_type:complete